VVARPVGANDLTDMVTAGGNLRVWMEDQLGRIAADKTKSDRLDIAPAWDADAARAWLRVLVADLGVLYRGLAARVQVAHADLFQRRRGPLLLPIGQAHAAQDWPAYKAALTAFDAAAAPIRAAARGVA